MGVRHYGAGARNAELLLQGIKALSQCVPDTMNKTQAKIEALLPEHSASVFVVKEGRGERGWNVACPRRT